MAVFNGMSQAGKDTSYKRCSDDGDGSFRYNGRKIWEAAENGTVRLPAHR